MSNVFGNRGGGGGFANPAEEKLNMNNYKITQLANGTDAKDAVNLSQLTTYNPFNQSLNITDNVQFQNVNMNGNWNIPNTQPASINDTNLYIISAQGGLITIPSGPSFTISAQMSSFPFYSVVIPIPPMAYTYLDLCQFIKTSYNTNPLGSNLIGTMTICNYVSGRLNIKITKDITHFAGTFTIIYDGLNTPSAALGYNATFTTPCDTTSIAQLIVVFSTSVGWKVLGSSTTPITNGSPYVYSSSQNKWSTSEILYTPDFLSGVDFSNTAYTINKNGINRFRIDITDAYIYSPNTVNFINVSNDGVSIVQNGVARVSSTAFSTYLMSPNGITDCSVSNNGVGLMVDTVARFSALSAGATTIKSADNQSIINMTNTDITMTQGGFTKFSMNEDQAIGTSLWGPSGSGRIQLINSGINLRQNSINRFTMNNAESYLYSPSLLNNSYISDTQVSLTFNNISRALINSSFTQLTSPNNTSSMTLTNTSSELRVNSSLRFVADGTETRILSPNFNVETTFNDTTYYVNMGGYERILIDATKCRTSSPNGLNYIDVNNSGLVYSVNGNVGTNGQVLTSNGTWATWANPTSGNPFNQSLNTTDSPTFVTVNTQNIQSTNPLTINVNSINREIITSLTSSFYSPNQLNSMVLSNNGNILTCSGSVLNLANAYLSYTLGGVQRCLINSSTLNLISNNTLSTVSITDSGVLTTLDAANSNTLIVGGLNKIVINNFTSTLQYNDANYVSISNSNIYNVKNNVTRVSISDTVENHFSPTNIMVTSQSDSLWQVTGGSSTGTKLIVTPTDASFILNSVTRIHSDNTHSQLVSPNNTQAIEVNNTGVQVNLTSNSYTLPTTRGTSGQVISITGSNCSWVTPTTSNPFNQNLNTTDSPTFVTVNATNIQSPGTVLTVGSSGVTTNIRGNFQLNSQIGAYGDTLQCDGVSSPTFQKAPIWEPSNMSGGGQITINAQAFFKYETCPYNMTITALSYYKLNTTSTTISWGIYNSSGVRLAYINNHTSALAGFQLVSLNTPITLGRGAGYYIGHSCLSSISTLVYGIGLSSTSIPSSLYFYNTSWVGGTAPSTMGTATATSTCIMWYSLS